MIDLIQYLGVIYLSLMALNVWIYFSVIEARPGVVSLLIWACILLVPVLGTIAWYLFGPRASNR